jgi:hypothetical protein
MITQIPFDKYQNRYKDFIYRFNSIPQQHLNRQIEYANKSGEVDIEIHRPIFFRHTHYNKQPQERKPYYVRDAKNPRILYPYKN